jgi:hypothetical protein
VALLRAAYALCLAANAAPAASCCPVVRPFEPQSHRTRDLLLCHSNGVTYSTPDVAVQAGFHRILYERCFRMLDLMDPLDLLFLCRFACLLLHVSCLACDRFASPLFLRAALSAVAP